MAGFDLKRHAPRLLLPLALAACNYPREPFPPVPILDPARARIDLRVRVLGEVTPQTLLECKEDIAGVLRRHGFVIDAAGLPVEVEAAILRDEGAMHTAATDMGGQLERSYAPPQAPAEPSFAADLTARIGDDASLRAGGVAPRHACASAAERLAVPLIGAIERR